MEVKIGIQNVPREIVVETNASVEEVEQALNSAVADATVLVLEDDKGGKVFVPAGKIAYVQVGAGEPRRVGFGAYS